MLALRGQHYSANVGLLGHVEKRVTQLAEHIGLRRIANFGPCNRDLHHSIREELNPDMAAHQDCFCLCFSRQIIAVAWVERPMFIASASSAASKAQSSALLRFCFM